jgi:serine/threonine protein kinase/predicted Zn-dependent protease
MTIIGKKIKQYEIVKKIGQGGMADVFKAYDSRLERFVAIKFLTRMLLQDQSASKRFLREARAASSLNHPNITTIYEIDKLENMDYIVMEFIDGVTLGKEIDKSPLEPIRVVEIMRQCASALGRAHAADIIHRDIKPDNIMITKDDYVKIMDFGLAKTNRATRITPLGYVLGTPAYMSPEQAQRIDVDGRCDIFSLGVVMYEALTGELPFLGDTEISVMYNVVHERPKPITTHNAQIPKELVAVVKTCMAKKTKYRYQTCEDLDSDLERIAETLNHGISDIPKSYALRTEQRRLMVKKWAMPGAVGFFILTLAAIIYFIIMPLLYPDMPRLAVLPVQDSTEQKELTNHRWSLAFALTKTLEQSDQLEVIPYGRVQDIFMSMNRIDEPVLDTESVMEVSKNLQADYIVWGLAQGTKNVISLTARIIELPSWDEDYAIIQAADLNGIFQNIDSLTTSIRSKVESNFTASEGGCKKFAELTTSNPEALRHFIEAERYISQIDIGPADASLQKAVELDSTFSVANALLARTTLYLGDSERKVDKYLARAERHLPNRPEKERMIVLLIKGMIRNNIEGGLEWVTEIENRYPNDERILMNMGDLYWKAGYLEDATRVFEKIIKMNPWHLYSLEALGNIMRARHEWNLAEQYLKQQIEVAPFIANAHHSLGYLYCCHGQFQKALEKYNEANRLRQGCALLDLGRTYELLGCYNEAEYYYNASIVAQHKMTASVIATQYLGNLLIKRGDLDDALRPYQIQLQKQPKNPLLLANLGKVLLTISDTTRCNTVLDTLAQVDSSQTWWYYLRAHKNVFLGNYESALRDFQTVKSSIDQIDKIDQFLSHEVKAQLASTYLKLDQIDIALDQYLELNKNLPRRPYVLLGMAQCYAIINRPKKAIQRYREVLDIWSTSTDINEEKQKIEAEINRLLNG